MTDSSSITKHAGGRPPLYKNVEDMQEIIDEYFKWCDNRAVKIWDDTKKSEIMISSPAPYTMSGLARRLGMNRRTLVDYAKKDEFLLTIKEARNKVEEDVESRMNEKHTFTPGLIFNAKNNFDWKDKSEVDNTVHLPQPLLDGLHNNLSSSEAGQINKED
jgi:hypothetical protein